MSDLHEDLDLVIKSSSFSFTRKQSQHLRAKRPIPAGGVNRLFDLRRCYMNRGRFRDLRSSCQIQAEVVRLRERLPEVA